MNDLTTSEKLKVWMKRKNYTQEEVAVKLGITRQTFILRMKQNELKPEERHTLTTMGFVE